MRTIDRRSFIVRVASSGGALVLGVHLPFLARAADSHSAAAVGPPQPDAFVRVGTDDSVTVICKYLDKGQGILTGVATLVAEELDADWAQMRAEYAPADVTRYKNNLLGVQGVGSSTSMPDGWDQLRRAGAAARAMLVAAAAQQWQVAPADVTVDRGAVATRDGSRRARFGELAAAAAAQPVPPQPVLKAPSQYKLIGTRVPRRLDRDGKTDGTQAFGLDVRRPGMLYAVLARPPRFGATLLGFDGAAAAAAANVKQVVGTPYGVAVLATDTWSAIHARELLKIDWDLSNAETRSSAQMEADFRRLLDRPGAVAKAQGDVVSAFGQGTRVVEADYSFPFLAHAPMEPLNATIEAADRGVVLHTGCQFQTVDQMSVADELGLKPEQVQVRTYAAGGSFGRRANPAADYVRQAAAVFKAAGGSTPVQLVWTRTDDLHGGYYRSMFLHRVRASVDGRGRLQGWQHRIIGHSIGQGTPFEPYMVKDGVDYTSTEGAAENTYGVPHFRCELHSPPKTVPILWWRSVGHSHTAYVVETMMDALARAARQDPVQFRLAHLRDQSRLAAVLKLAAEKGGWGKPLPKGKGRGVAVHESFGTFVAHVAEVTMGRDGAIRVDRLVGAVDCGLPVNPDIITAQMEGGAGFALSALLHDAITFSDGVVDQNNFDRYPLLRIGEMPKVETHIVRSAERPSGIGEPPVPTVGPAVANAVFAATGRRVTRLPLAAA